MAFFFKLDLYDVILAHRNIILFLQIRKDLNELPEMKKAKELRAESERKQIEIESMRELAKLEEELKRKVADEQDGEDKGGEEPEHNPEKQQSAEEGQQQHHEHLKVCFWF